MTKFNTNDKIISTWIEHPNRKGIISDEYNRLGLSGEQLKQWKKKFELIKWSDNNEFSGEIRKYLFKDETFTLKIK